jgi:glutamate/aspartate transport system substrate-binding protein
MNIQKLLALACLTGCIQLAQGQPTDTLKKIKESGVFSMGYRETSIPFSYAVGGEKPIGFSIELCAKIVENIKLQLKKPDIKIVYTAVTPTNRIPLLQNGTIDMECGAMTNTLARQQQISFSPSIFLANVTGMVKKTSGINALTDLEGKPVVMTAGSTAVQLMRINRRTEATKVIEMYGRDHYESFLMLSNDRAAAFLNDDILMAGLIASSQSPQDFKLLSDVLRTEPYAVALRKDDAEFKKLVDHTVKELMTSGALTEMYERWFTKPIPPKNVNLNFPMSSALRELYSTPNDKGI